MGDEEETPKGIGTYTGARNDAKEREGQGVATYPNGDVYDGSYVAGARSGFGTYYFGGKEGAKATYVGEYAANKKCGQGKMTYPDGTTVRAPACAFAVCGQ
jgi:hypothetical protein